MTPTNFWIPVLWSEIYIRTEHQMDFPFWGAAQVATRFLAGVMGRKGFVLKGEKAQGTLGTQKKKKKN